MDQIVRLGLKKWPNVPSCFGWLGLDARGRWRIGQERETISHAPTLAFIGRNYLSDAKGRWYFQNGPQQVFVDLEYTPWIWHLMTTDDQWSLVDHVGNAASSIERVFIDDRGQFVLFCDARVGVLHDHDSSVLLERLYTASGVHPNDHELARSFDLYLSGRDGELSLCWPHSARSLTVESIRSDAVAERFGFIPHPLEGDES